ncbi:MAG TPA: O-antigen ligase family protein [Terriglobales bacterium]|nr:O-antigen ligase family protein [Terriglobales bacterium]
MNPHVALFICVVGIAGLFYLDRDASARPSRALWIPVLWLAIAGSRAVSVWFGIAPPEGVNVQMEGSPVDRLFFQVLLVAGIIVLVRRSSRAGDLLKANWPLILYFSYCLLSVFWSEFPDVSLKRWTKAIGDLVMVLVVATDAEPVAALKHLLSRLGFVLLPASILLIHYFGDLGRAYTPDGVPMNTGVSTTKNELGVITFVLTLGAVWRVLSLLENKEHPARGRHLWAQLTLLAIAVWVLVMAQSATSIACVAFGAALMLATRTPAIRRRPGAVHALVLAIILAGAVTFLLGGQSEVVQALGRKDNLSGRTDIWAAVLGAGTNPLLGAGFESFWITPSYLAKFVQKLVAFGWWDPGKLNEAHCGYLEVYLELGWVGVSMIALILISGYRASTAAFRRDPQIGGLMLAYVATAAVYSITEAGFRMLLPMWIFLLLVIVVSRRITAEVGERVPERLRGTRRKDIRRTGQQCTERRAKITP